MYDGVQELHTIITLHPPHCQTETATWETTPRINESNAEDPLKPEAMSGRAVWSPSAEYLTTCQNELTLRLPPPPPDGFWLNT